MLDLPGFAVFSSWTEGGRGNANHIKLYERVKKHHGEISRPSTTTKISNITTDDLAALHGVLHSSRRQIISSHSVDDQDQAKRITAQLKKQHTHAHTHIYGRRQ